MNIEFNKNEDAMKLAWSQVKQQLEKIYEGGGKKSAAKQKERNKLTARERIAYLCDKETAFVEIGAFAGFDMYPDEGGCPAGGTVSGIGYVSGRQAVIVANDQTVKAGAWFPITAAICVMPMALIFALFLNTLPKCSLSGKISSCMGKKTPALSTK